MTVFKYALFRNLQNPFSFLATSVGPIALIFLMTDIWTYIPTIGVSYLAMLMIWSSHLSSVIILEDRIDGSIIRIAVSPVSTLSYITQNLFAIIIPSFMQVAILAIVGLFRYNWSAELTIGIFISLILFSIANTAFAFCWSMVFKKKENSKWAFLVVTILIAFFGGLMMPTEILPDFMQSIGAIVHPYWLMRAVNGLVQYGITLNFWLFNLVTVLFAIAYLLLGGRRKGV